MDLGAILRQAREARELTCDHLARTTRIPLRIILAMERDDWASVPGGIFTRGYLLAYAREVGLDGQALAARIDASRASPLLEEKTRPADASEPRRRLPTLTPWTRRRVARAAFVSLLLGAFFVGRWSVSENMPVSAPEAAAGALGGQVPGTVGTASTPAVPVESTPDTSASRTAEGAATGGGAEGDTLAPGPDADLPLTAELSVTRPCWVTGLADGTRFLYRTVQPGERIQIRGSEFVFRVGDAGAVQLSLNGEQARPLGENGEVANLRISGENYRSFLRTP